MSAADRVKILIRKEALTDGLAILYMVCCFIICGFGIWVYSKKKDVPLYIGIAFGLFGIDRLIVFLGLTLSWDIVGVVLRIVA